VESLTFFLKFETSMDAPKVSAPMSAPASRLSRGA
jgi:hypothetical protein